MSHSKGPWIYDAESGEIHTKDRTGFWGPDHEPLVVATVEPLDGVNNGPLLAAASELLEALMYCESWFSKHSPLGDLITGEVAEHPMLTCIRAAISKAEGKQ